MLLAQVLTEPRAVTLQIDAAHQTQTEKDRLRTRLFIAQIRALNNRRLSVFHQSNIIRGIALVTPTQPPAIVRMRRTAKTVVRRSGPVFRVVPRFKSWQTEILDLVMLVTRGNNFADEYAIHLRGKIVV